MGAYGVLWEPMIAYGGLGLPMAAYGILCLPTRFRPKSLIRNDPSPNGAPREHSAERFPLADLALSHSLQLSKSVAEANGAWPISVTKED